MIIKADQLMFRQEEIYLQTQTKLHVNRHQHTMAQEKGGLLMEALLQIDQETVRQVLDHQIQIQHLLDPPLLVKPLQDHQHQVNLLLVDHLLQRHPTADQHHQLLADQQRLLVALLEVVHSNNFNKS
jgi:hypothetical protein